MPKILLVGALFLLSACGSATGEPYNPAQFSDVKGGPVIFYRRMHTIAFPTDFEFFIDSKKLCKIPDNGYTVINVADVTRIKVSHWVYGSSEITIWPQYNQIRYYELDYVLPPARTRSSTLFGRSMMLTPLEDDAEYVGPLIEMPYDQGYIGGFTIKPSHEGDEKHTQPFSITHVKKEYAEATLAKQRAVSCQP